MGFDKNETSDDPSAQRPRTVVKALVKPRFIEYWLPRRYREGAPREQLQAYRTVSVAWLGIASAILSTVPYLVFAPDHHVAPLAQAALSLAGLATLEAFRRGYIERRVTQNIHLALGHALITGISWANGGIKSPGLYWLIIIPAAAVLLDGVRRGIPWMILGAATTALFALLERGHLAPEPVLPTAGLPVITAAELVLFMAVLFLGAAYLSRFTDRALDEQEAHLELVRRERDTAGALTQELRKTVNELKDARDAAQASVRARDIFLANMSHEIRTPMNAVLGGLSLLEASSLTGEQRRLLGEMQTGGKHLLTLLNDLMDLAASQHGALTLQPEHFSALDVIDDALRTATSQAAHKGLNIRIATSSVQDDTVYADPARVRQVLMNLVGNAVKYTDEGWVELVVLEADRVMRFEVTDSGPGVAEEDRERIFGAFDRAEQSANRRHGGAGLGLSICRTLAHAMNGRIGVAEGPEGGSTFWFEVPKGTRSKVARTQVPSTQLRVQKLSYEQRPETLEVLVVDDNSTNVLIASQMARALGAQPVTAKGGREAVLLCRERPFALIFMDCEMPEMDGFEATLRIREHHSPNQRSPIVALTGAVQPEQIKKCFQVGMNGHLGKPIQLPQIREVMATFAPHLVSPESKAVGT